VESKATDGLVLEPSGGHPKPVRLTLLSHGSG
jgi:hypothetical protein